MNDDEFDEFVLPPDTLAEMDLEQLAILEYLNLDWDWTFRNFKSKRFYQSPFQFGIFFNSSNKGQTNE